MTATATQEMKDTKKNERFSAEERSAMKERAKELKASGKRADEEAAMLEKIAEMKDADRVIAERLHAVVKANAPMLSAKLWYGMPAYSQDDKILCFFQCAEKFNTRYATLGFNDIANLDDGTMWPSAFALAKLTAADEARIGALLKKAVAA